MADTTFSNGTVVEADWLNDVNDLTYNFTQSGTGAVPRPAQDKLREIKSTADYSSWAARNICVGGSNFSNGAAAVENIGLGYDILKALTTGYANIGVGVDDLSANTTGAFNIAIGAKTLYKNTTGSGNVSVGSYSAYENKTGSDNVGVGVDSNRYVDGGNLNVAVGTQSLYNNVTGVENVAVGPYAARNATNPPDDGAGTGPSPTYLTAIGSRALYTATGTLNVGVGYSAGYNLTGSYNSCFGSNAGLSATTGANNLFAGYDAGNNASQLVTASGVTALGKGAYTTGSNSVAVGIATVSASNGVAIGQSATVSANAGIAIGPGASVTAANSIAIGNGVAVSTTNITVIGNSSNTGNYFYGGMQPQIDNTYPVGGGSSRWSVIYAGTGTINTSDAREKQDIRPLDERERAVAGRLKALVRAYRWRNAVSEKGDAARTHIGWIAQDVVAAFEAEGLDAFAYGCCCYDEIDRPGGRYSVRMDQITALIISST